MTVSKTASQKRKSKRRKSRSTRLIHITAEKLEKSKKMLPWIGYFILGLTFLDYVFLLVPFHFLNAAWELNILGHVVENVWAPLLGFALIFIRQGNSFKVKELKLLSWLSRIMLVMAIIYFLSTPLIISNTIKIQGKKYTGLKNKLEIQKKQVAQFKKQLDKIPEEQLANYLLQNELQDSSATKNSTKGPILQRALDKLEEEQVKSIEQAQTQYRQQKLSLIKRSLKWCIGAILSGAIFLLFWKNTEWTRKTSPRES